MERIKVVDCVEPSDMHTLSVDADNRLYVSLQEAVDMIRSGLLLKVDMPQEDKDILIRLLQEV